MSNSTWQKIEDIFPLVADLPEPQRSERLRELCGGDEDLRREIVSLLAADEKAETFIEDPAQLRDFVSGAFAAANFKNSPTRDLTGEKIGAYRIERKIGAGGMGAVYLAERADGEFRKRVAIKLVRSGADTTFNLRRFRHERQILAALEHPNIARLIDGGTTADGAPYFVLEYVEGEPLFDFCRARDLNLHERLQLFRQICAAVAYAHAQGIVHRDLKPGNILVTDTGIVKLLDFGIAKIFNSDSIPDSIGQTETLLRQMTPEYASPEQICGDEITPASDAYSLGVVLYELVTGERPYKFPSRAPHEIARVICEEKVQSPKSKVQSPLSDDLIFIVLKALEKKPSERYAAVADFDRDIAGVLDGLPLQKARTTGDFAAHPTDKIETSRKFKTRTAVAAVAGAGLLCTALIVGAANFKILVLKKDESPNPSPAAAPSPQQPPQRDQNEKPRTNDAVADSLYLAGKQQLETRTPEGVNRAIEFFNEAAARDPEFALAFSGLADAHIVLAGQQKDKAASGYRKAEEHAVKALALDPDLAEARVSLGMATFRNTKNFAAAEKHFLRAIEINGSLSRARHWYSVILGDTGQIEAALREIKIAAELEPRSAVIHHNVGIFNMQLKRYADAIAYFDKTIEIDEGYVNVYLSKTIAHQMLGDYNGARETYRIGRIYSGKDENEPVWILVQAQAHAAEGRREDALTLLNRVLRTPAYRKEMPKLIFDIVLVYTLLDDKDNAFAWLEKVKIKNSKEITGFSEDPRLANLQSDERLAALVKKWQNLITNQSKK